MTTKIEWCDETINPITGCTPVSAGCANCYAKRMAQRLAGRDGYPVDDPFRPGVFHPGELEKLAKWKKPRRVFVSSMGDLFHECVSFGAIDRVFIEMCLCDWHTYMLLTKRPAKLTDFVSIGGGPEGWRHSMPHVHFGVTAENQETADERVPILLQIPAAVRFVSVEPLLGPVRMRSADFSDTGHGPGWLKPGNAAGGPKIDWVIIGAETGPHRRPCRLEWVVDLVRQCKTAGVPVFVKKVEIDGRITGNMADWPEEIRYREVASADYDRGH